MKKIICIGSATKDIFIGVEPENSLKCDNIALDGDANSKKNCNDEEICFRKGAKIYSNNYRESVAGGAVNFGASLTKLGYRAFVFARTNKGAGGKWIQKQIGKLKLKKNYMQQNGGEVSQTSVVIFDEIKKDRIILRSGDSVERFDLKKAFKKFRERVDWIYVSSQKKNNIENLDLILNFAEGKGARLAINPSSYQIKNNREEFLERLQNIKILFVNLDEGARLVREGISDLREDESKLQEFAKKIIEQLLEYGMKVVSVTDGDNGAWVATKIKDKAQIYYLRTDDKDIVDTTGAGDAFAAGFLFSYMEQEGNMNTLLDEKLKVCLASGFANGLGVISEIGAVNGILKLSKLRRQAKKLLKEVEEV